TALAFAQVQQALSFIVNSYAEIAEWQSVVNRLVGFEAAIAHARREAAGRAGIAQATGAERDIALDDVDLALPNGQPLLDGGPLSPAPGARVLLPGPWGAGKSPLSRPIAGIGLCGGGPARRPAGARVLFLPQKPSLPIGTLREVVSYPTAAGGVSDEA